MQRNPFKHHRFPLVVILCAVAGVTAWPFRTEIAERPFKHRSWRGLNWHVPSCLMT